MGFFAWLETTSVAHWVQVSTLGYPLVITAHAVGMGIVTGLSWFIAMRLLGWFRVIPLEALKPLFRIAWVGFAVNALSGGALFMSQAASNYIHNIPYLTKMVFVVLGVTAVVKLQRGVSRQLAGQVGSDVVLPQSLRIWAVATIFIWLGAIVSGRLIAYLG